MTEQAPWWDALDEHIAGRQDDGVEDPWGDVSLPAPPLTPDQRTYVEQLADQPPVPRLRGALGEATGNSPGDPAPETGVPSSP
jgi:hypothetical protein